MEQQSLTNETQPVGTLLPAVIESIDVETLVNRFISANTIEGNLYDINNVHIIPSYQRDYRPLIGHGEFVDHQGLPVKFAAFCFSKTAQDFPLMCRNGK
jgi:hypothetical protein